MGQGFHNLGGQTIVGIGITNFLFHFNFEVACIKFIRYLL